MKQAFETQMLSYNRQSEVSHFKKENVRATLYGIQSVRYLGPKIWYMIPDTIKSLNSVN